MGSSRARVTCETSQVLLAGDQVVILGYLPFSPHFTFDSAQNEISLTGRKTQIINPLSRQISMYALKQRQKHTYLYNLVESRVCVAFICLLRMNAFVLNLVIDITFIDLRRGKS